MPRPDFEESHHPIEDAPRHIIEDEPIIEEVGTNDRPIPVEDIRHTDDRDESDDEDELSKKSNSSKKKAKKSKHKKKKSNNDWIWDHN